MQVEPWTSEERKTIYSACKSGKTEFDKGNLRWEATVQRLEWQLGQFKESLGSASALQKVVDGLHSSMTRCQHYVSQGLREPSGVGSMKKALNRIAAELRHALAKPTV